MTKTADTKAPLEIGEVLSHSPVPGIVVRMQRVAEAAYVVMVSRTLLVDGLRRSYPTEAQARAYAKGICLDLLAGWTLDEIASELLVVSAA